MFNLNRINDLLNDSMYFFEFLPNSTLSYFFRVTNCTAGEA